MSTHVLIFCTKFSICFRVLVITVLRCRIYKIVRRWTYDPNHSFESLSLCTTKYYVREYTLDGMVFAVIERSTATLRVTGSIPARNKYLFDLQVVIPHLAVCVSSNVCKCTYDTGFLLVE